MLRTTVIGALVTGVVVACTFPGAPAADAAPQPFTSPPSADDPLGHGLTKTSTPRLTAGVNAKVKQADTAAAARTFLASNKSRYRIDTSSTALVHSDSSKSRGVTVERFDQRYDGIPVFGGQYVVRVKDEGSTATVLGTSGDYLTDLKVDTKATVSLAYATRVAKNTMRPHQWKAVTSVKDNGPVVLPTGAGVLTRHLTLLGKNTEAGLPLKQEIYVARGRTTPVLNFSNIQTDGPTTTTGDAFHSPTLPLNVFKRGATYELRDQSRPMFATDKGEIRTYDAQGRDYNLLAVGDVPDGVPLVTSTTVPFAAASNQFGALDAHWGAGKVYDYYRALGRDSLDGKGGSIKSVVNVTDNGSPYANAFWNGDMMVYGTGRGGFRPFAAALDVVAHEMTHGVVSNSSKLVYIGQSGAANEAFADYFGNAIENNTITPPAGQSDGLLGESSCDSTIPPAKCALRDLNELMTTFDFYNGTEDNGGVHLNSTILSGALWQVRHDLGATLADSVLYDVMTQYLTPLSQFIDVRTALVAAAKAHGVSASQISKIDAAFVRHGIVADWEKKIQGADSKVLLSPLYGMAGPENRGDKYVVPSFDFQTSKSVIYTGRLSTPGAKLISPDGEDLYDVPATDGKDAVWANSNWTSGNDHTVIQRRSLTGGPISTVADLGKDAIWDLAIDGKTVAWQTNVGDLFRVRAKLANGTIVEMPSTPTTRQMNPEVSGNYILYSDQVADFEEFSTASLKRYDIRTGKIVTLATIKGEVDSSAMIFSPMVIGRDVLFLSDAQYRLRAGVSSVPLNGGKVKVIVPESDPVAPTGAVLGANKGYVTWENTNSFANPTKVYLRSRKGGAIQRVSCGTGSQSTPMLGIGSTVGWVDTTTSSPALVTRDTPKGTCPVQ